MTKLDEQFNAAVWIVQNLPKDGPINNSVDDQLRLYSLFKQATEGPCTTSKPSLFHVTERLKWNAWNKISEMDRDEAKARYIEKLLELCDRAEREHNLVEYLSDPKYTDDPKYMELLQQHAVLREKFAILGRSNVKGYEGKTITVKGIELTL